MKNVLIKGPLLSNCGYGYHSRQVYKWLKTRENIKIHTNVLDWGNNPWIYNDVLSDDIIKNSLNNSSVNIDESYQIQFPFEWKKYSNYDVGITAGIESNYCNPEMLRHINKMNKVIVPSNFAKETFLNTSNLSNFEITTKIEVIPESFHEKELESSILDLKELDTDFNFLVFGQVNSENQKFDRKNLLKTLKCVIETFKDNSDVGILLKTNSSNNSKRNYHFCKNMINRFLVKNNLTKANRKCKLYFLHGNLSKSEVISLYENDKIKSLVSGTRSEGYGLIHLESAAYGLPVISTNWSGYKDFLEEDFLKVKYDLVSCNNNNLFHNKSEWAEFDFEDMKYNLIDMYKNQTQHKIRALELQKRIKQNYNIRAIIDKYNKCFEEEIC